MSSHHGQVVGSIMLGLIFDTNKLTIVIPHKYLNELLNLLNSTWHPNWHCFKVSKAKKLTEKLARLSEEANWVFHLLSHIHSSIAYALSKNKRLLLESLVSFLQSSKSCELALSRSHTRIWPWPGIHCLQWNGQQNILIMIQITTILSKEIAKSWNFSVTSSNPIWILTGKLLSRT